MRMFSTTLDTVLRMPWGESDIAETAIDPHEAEAIAREKNKKVIPSSITVQADKDGMNYLTISIPLDNDVNDVFFGERKSTKTGAVTGASCKLSTVGVLPMEAYSRVLYNDGVVKEFPSKPGQVVRLTVSMEMARGERVEVPEFWKGQAKARAKAPATVPATPTA